ncbi:hypothetical protein PXJ20_02670 [Paraburkholderia sp. A1RI_3L]|jgi:hypothetical protein|nr:hypothetical protein [Paraburkholderia kururiensis]
MNAMKRIFPALLCVAAAACTTRGEVKPEVMQIATTPLTCTSKSQCDAWWQRAQTWVKDHSKYELQTVNDSLIQTAGPDGGRRALAFEITKTPNPDGSMTIGFAAHCDSSLGCKPDPWNAGADFKAYVRGSGPGMPATPPAPAATQKPGALPDQPAAAPAASSDSSPVSQ